MPDPRVIVHASVSIDGCMTGFLPDLGVHYAAAAGIPAQARLIGSVTMDTGLTMFGGSDPAPAPDVGNRMSDRSLPFWVVVDGTGRLAGRLHQIRAFPGVREVLVLISGSTPQSYREYLHEHGYPWLASGERHVDLAAGLAWLRREWEVEQVLVDSGPTLTSVLLDGDLVDEAHLLVHPVVVGRGGRHLFEEVAEPVAMTLAEQSSDDGVLRLRYVRRSQPRSQ